MYLFQIFLVHNLLKMFNVVLYFRLLKEGDIYTISFDFFDNYGKSDRFKHLIFKRIFQNSSKRIICYYGYRIQVQFQLKFLTDEIKCSNKFFTELQGITPRFPWKRLIGPCNRFGKCVEIPTSWSENYEKVSIIW